MALWEVWLIAVGLAMDCFTVSIASGIILRRVVWRPMLTMALLFGLFQALMPLIGWGCTNAFSTLIENVDHWIAFGLLAFLGGRMIKEGRESGKEEHPPFNPLSLKVVLALAVATSIDALAVGISFACLGMDSLRAVALPVTVTGIVSFLFSAAGLGIGIVCGRRFHWPVEQWGGVLLILIGCKILCEHLMN